MLVFYKARLVFLAMPKTGSTAYHSALGPCADLIITDPPELKHAPLFRYDRFFRPIYEKVCGLELETMAVMREPVSWLGSWYRYRQRPFLKGKPNSTSGISFDDFVRAYMKGERPTFANIGSQSKFLEPRTNGSPITHLFRYEKPERLNAFLSDRLSHNFHTDQENVSPAGNLDLSEETYSRFRRKFSHEFELYESISPIGQ